MRVVHLSVAREFGPGLIKQLSMENAASQQLGANEWRTLAYHEGVPLGSHIRRIPWPFRALFLRNLWAWIVALRFSREADIIILRHITFDPFAVIFSRLISNRVSIHHAKELEELRLIRKGWRGKAATFLERYTAAVAARRTVAILGVTREIAEYQRYTHKLSKAVSVYSNGIDPASTPVLDDRRSQDAVEFAFICGRFTAWHGLDKIISAVDSATDQNIIANITINLIGGLTEAQLTALQETKDRRRVFKSHGFLDSAGYRSILERCDAGIGSLAMERQNLREGSTLKVREMLAMGLAVYSGHQDSAFPPGEKFVMVVDAPDLPEMFRFGQRAKLHSRQYVRDASLKYIDKRSAMEGVISFLGALRSDEIN